MALFFSYYSGVRWWGQPHMQILLAPALIVCYSCLAALPNGKVGLLYETSNQPQAVDAVRFRELSLEGPWDWERTL